jgi:cytochrome P450
VTLDLRDPGFLVDPGPDLARLRARGPLVRLRLPLVGEVWMTTTDAAAREVLKDEARFARDRRHAGRGGMERVIRLLPPFVKPLTANMILKDGADHQRLRQLVDRAFARAQIESLRPEIAAIADALLDRIDPSGPVEIIGAYTRALPLQVISALLGVPEADRARVARLIAPISGPTGVLTGLAALPGLWRLTRYFRALFAEVRRSGRPGLIRELVAAEADGDRLSEDELLAMVFLLFVAGHETTVHLIDNAIGLLAASPEARAALADPGRAGLMVEEVLRHASPVMMTKVFHASADFDFHGQRLQRGDQVAALLIGANRDPARHEAPEVFRPDRRPNAHLGFGFGPHICVGMQLARAEAQIALERLFARFPGLGLAEPPRWSGRLGIRGPARLWLRLR